MKTYLLRHKSITGVAVFLLIVNSFFQVYAATQMTNVANHLIERDQSRFFKSLLVVLLLWGITFVIGYFQLIIQEKAIQKMSKSIRLDLASKIGKMEMSHFSKAEIQRYTSFMQNDINLIEEKGFKSFFFISRFLANGIFSLVALLLFNVYLFALALLLLALLNLVPKLLRYLTREGNEEVSTANNRFLSLMQDVINGYETLKMFSAERKFVSTIDKGSTIISDARIDYAKKQSLVNVVISTMNISSQIAVIFTTGLLVFQGALSVGAILSTTELSTKIFDSFGVVNQYYILLDSISPLFKVIDDGVAAKEPTPAVKTFEAIDLKEVSFAYSDKSKDLLQNFTYRFERGGKYHIIGASGSGKSTLLKLIFKQLAPTEGQIYLNRAPYTEADLVSVSQYLKQDTHIFNFDLDDNITLGRTVDQGTLKTVKELVGVDQLDAGNLSGGEKQLVSLARVLVSPKPLIILDESFSNVDLETAQRMIAYLMSTEATIILITHRESELSNLNFEKVSLII